MSSDPLASCGFWIEYSVLFLSSVHGLDTVLDTVWTRCFQLSTDGDAVSTFHAQCDHKGPTVTVAKLSTGKVVVRVSACIGEARAAGSHLVTGGTGGLGLLTAANLGVFAVSSSRSSRLRTLVAEVTRCMVRSFGRRFWR